MSCILSIETATSVCSVAIHRDGELLAVQSLLAEKSHATHLAVIIEQLLANCQLEMKELSAIAVSKGPGSYTGLRIGVATAKGLCYGLNIPLIGVNTLLAMAHQFADKSFTVDYLCPMIDARRMEVYCMMLDGELEVLETTQPKVVAAGTFDQWVDKGRVLFFGNGSEKCKEVLNNENCMFASNVVPTAATVGALGTVLYEDGETEDLAYFEPYYLKEYQTTVPKNKAGFVNER